MGGQLHVQDALMERRGLLVYDVCAGFRVVPVNCGTRYELLTLTEIETSSPGAQSIAQ